MDMITIDLQPAKIVEDIGFQKLIAILDPRYHFPSRDLLPARYERCSSILIEVLGKIESCTLTTDFWTSRANESYITVTCHFIDGTWETQIICIEHLQCHWFSQCRRVAEELKYKWKISDKITCVVTDNASNMTAALKLTDWKNLPCFAHTINLIVQEAVNKDSVLAALRKVS